MIFLRVAFGILVFLVACKTIDLNLGVSGSGGIRVGDWQPSFNFNIDTENLHFFGD